MKLSRKKRAESTLSVQTVPKSMQSEGSLFSRYRVSSKTERELYSSLRESVPVIDAAICKIIRLIGRVGVELKSEQGQRLADDFIENVKINGGLSGLNNFMYSYLESLLTYGEAAGEMIPYKNGEGIGWLYNASLDDIEIKADKNPLELIVCLNEAGEAAPVKNQSLVMASLLNPEPGTVKGKSILSGLPFVSSILLKIFGSVKTNWERVGDVRFAVTCNNDSNGVPLSKENARLIADEWRKAMRSDCVCDFISAGDVSIKVIGAESQMPDCEVPIRSVMEQILAKLGIPPFLLGFSWSSTERMSEQQADILTSELDYYRSIVEPVIKKTVGTHLRLCGCNEEFKIVWNNINLQDAVELSQARLNNAQAAVLENENKTEVVNGK